MDRDIFYAILIIMSYIRWFLMISWWTVLPFYSGGALAMQDCCTMTNSSASVTLMHCERKCCRDHAMQMSSEMAPHADHTPLNQDCGSHHCSACPGCTGHTVFQSIPAAHLPISAVFITRICSNAFILPHLSQSPQGFWRPPRLSPTSYC